MSVFSVKCKLLQDMPVLIESVQSVPAARATDPRMTCRVSAADGVGSGIFRLRFHLVLYYKKASDEDSGWLLAGWAKEFMGRALQDFPILAGRLRRSDDGHEIVSNDSGVRLVEARTSKTMVEFLDFPGREEAEVELVAWKDIDEQNPDFSPLLYIQVTNFECGGYSIGVSCSPVLVDPLTIICFLRKWAEIHGEMMSGTEGAKLPVFYLPKLKPNRPSPANTVGLNPSKGRGKSVIFTAHGRRLNLGDHTAKSLSLLCVAEAESKLGLKTDSKFSVIVKETSGVVKVESLSGEGPMQKPLDIVDGLNPGSWDDLGAGEIGFVRGNKPVGVSYWINSLGGEGLVILIPSPSESVWEMKVVVTIPEESEILRN